MVNKMNRKIFACLLSLLLLFLCIPVAAAGTETEFVPENLFSTHLLNKSAIVYYSNNGTVVANTRFDSKGALEASVDGDITTQTDAYAYSGESTNWIGALYELDASYYCDKLVLYSGLAAYTDCYRVFASDDLDMLYNADGLVSSKVVCNGEAVEVSVNKTVRYVAIVFDNTSSTDTVARIFEYQLWSGEAADAFVPQNLTNSDALTSSKVILMDVSSGAVSEDSTGRVSADGAAAIIAGNPGGSYSFVADALGFEYPKYVGFAYSFDQSYFIGDVIIDAGYESTSTSDRTETYDVYVSDSEETLYSSASKVASGVTCKNGASRVTVNGNGQYVAVVCTNDLDGMRIKQIAVMSGDASSVFVSENLLQTHLANKTGIIFYTSSLTAVEDTRFNSRGALDASVDGDLSTHVDMYAYSDTSANWIGARYDLDDTYYCGEVTLLSGYSNLKDYFRVYASDNLDTLYSSTNMVAESAECAGDAVKLDIGRNVKYLAVIFDNIAAVSNNARIVEFQLWSGDASSVFISENVLRTDLASTELTAMYVSNGSLLSSNRFDLKGALAASTDDDLVTTAAVYDCIDGWEYPIYPGVVYTLNNTVFIEKAAFYANGKLKVYASDSLDSLYSSGSLIADSVKMEQTGSEININKNVKYFAVFCDGYVDVVEFQLWSGDPNAAPEEPAPEDNSVKVLTIGNSFAENASIYASEIAYANGKELTFGYLKFPSCTLAMHLQAATEDLAVFKFEITAPDGTRTRIANEAASFDAPDTTNCATIAQALAYTDWDVIVFQQESFSSLDASTFAPLGDLITYVRGYCPTARLMFHEVWSWGSWENDPDKNFAKIKANAEAAARTNDLEIIPSGIAFENARAALGSYTVVNDDDGYWQHANTYGQYLAGCAYVGAIFDIEIAADTFVSHPYVNDNGQVAVLTEAANRAVDYYHSYGDLNDDDAINADDAVLLRQYLLSAADVDTTLADTNNDGDVDIRDLVRLKRYFADDTVVLG